METIHSSFALKNVAHLNHVTTIEQAVHSSFDQDVIEDFQQKAQKSKRRVTVFTHSEESALHLISNICRFVALFGHQNGVEAEIKDKTDDGLYPVQFHFVKSALTRLKHTDIENAIEAYLAGTLITEAIHTLYLSIKEVQTDYIEDEILDCEFLEITTTHSEDIALALQSLLYILSIDGVYTSDLWYGKLSLLFVHDENENNRLLLTMESDNHDDIVEAVADHFI